MNPARLANGFLRIRVGHFSYMPLNSSLDVESELWTLLEYYSETTTVTSSLMRSRGYVNGAQRNKAVKDFRSYVRQAKAYYESAKLLPARSSALLYYYSFLNLVKAGLVVHDRSCLGKKFYHGQKAKGMKERLLEDHSQEVKRGSTGVDVLPTFYELYIGRPLQLKHFSIGRLFAYCSEIGYQYLVATNLRLSILPSYAAIRVNHNQANPAATTHWPLIAISGFPQILPHKKSLADFNRDFQQVQLDPNEAREIFGLMAEQLPNYTLFEGKDHIVRTGPLIPSLTQNDILNSLGPFLLDNYFSDNHDFSVLVPYRLRNQIPVNEAVAIYIVMHHISEMVRYEPTSLENMLSRKESWLIESFVRSCPPTFLREIIAWILGSNFVIDRR